MNTNVTVQIKWTRKSSMNKNSKIMADIFQLEKWVNKSFKRFSYQQTQQQ